MPAPRTPTFSGGVVGAIESAVTSFGDIGSPVGGRGQTGVILEDPSEVLGVVESDPFGDRIDRERSVRKQELGFVDPDDIAVVDRCQLHLLLEEPKEVART